MTPRPCGHDTDAGEPGCGVCDLGRRSPRVLALWANASARGEPLSTPGGQGTKGGPERPPALTPGYCPHRGGPTGRTVGCRTCQNRDNPLQLHVLSCDLHGECVTGDRAPASDKVKACRWCPDNPANRPPPPAAVPPEGRYQSPTRRHALMHVLPVADGSGTWERSVARLCQSRGEFASVTIAAATGAHPKLPLADADAVRRAAPWAEVLEVPNDPDRREVATWGPLWNALTPRLKPEDAVLYCHAKGVTHPPGSIVHRWASLCWSLVLGHPWLVDEQLRRHPVTGPFLKRGPSFGGKAGRFHYSGTFFWLRADDYLRRRCVVRPPERWWGVEAWPGVAYHPDDAGCLFLEGREGEMDLYRPEYWESTVLPEYEKWASRTAG